MRKLKLQMQVSIDGFVAEVNGGMSWLVWDWDEELKDYVKAITEPVDTILLGRVLAQGFIPAWAERVANPATDEVFARKMHETHRVVFSKSLQSHEWNNASLATGDTVEEVTALKNAPGGDIITYGGSSFAGSLIHHGLIDELHLFVNPTALGSGMPIFTEHTKLKFTGSRAFDCGIVVLVYEPVR